jgi:hypothetical protein
MLERSEPVLKVLCAAFAAILLFQAVRLLMRSEPLAHLNIPAVPTLPPDTNAPAGGAATNSLAASGTRKAGTNAARDAAKIVSAATNSSSGHESGKIGTNDPHSVAAQKGTNPPSPLAESKTGTNSSTEPRSGTKETNAVSRSGPRPDLVRTNLSATLSGVTNRGPGVSAGVPPQTASMGMGPPGRPGIMTAPELPLPIQARVDRITDSEILGPIMRPLPMALLGIAGDVAFLRAANGQAGIVKEGDSLGSLKLLQIGTNRVLVEDGGQKKELTIFSGYGGESLLPKEKDNSP